MKHDTLMDCTKEELEAYAEYLGINLESKKGISQKVAAIEQARSKCVDITVFGHIFTIPIKAAHDQRAADILQKGSLTDEEVMRLLELLLGEKQLEDFIELCTDEDGVVDVEAMAVAMRRIITSDKLKNF
jgi:hypothetical protein